jgi:hypothetical protein
MTKGNGAAARQDASTASELLLEIQQAVELLAGMDADWWLREKHNPTPSDSSATIIDPASEAAWHRRQAATKYRDALRVKATRLCLLNSRLLSPPAPTNNAEIDISCSLLNWCLDARNVVGGYEQATPPAPSPTVNATPPPDGAGKTAKGTAKRAGKGAGKSARKPGKPRIAAAEEAKRLALLERYERASTSPAKVKPYQFCKDESKKDPSITVAYLRKCQAWANTRNTRKNL